MDASYTSHQIINMKLLLDGLQRRGFLVLLRQGKIFLHRDSPDEDVRVLKQCRLTVTPLNHPRWRLRISVNDVDVNQVLKKVRNIPTKHSPGLAGATQPPVPVTNLEPGIALFVKVLQLWGIRTEMSCEGHPGRQ